jgi:hypothetical protein
MTTKGKKIMQWQRLIFWHDLYIFLRPSSGVLKDSTHAVQVNRILLSNGQYVFVARRLIKRRDIFMYMLHLNVLKLWTVIWTTEFIPYGKSKQNL